MPQLDLSNNQQTGGLLGGLTTVSGAPSLTTLLLHSNKLTGDLPSLYPRALVNATLYGNGFTSRWWGQVGGRTAGGRAVAALAVVAGQFWQPVASACAKSVALRTLHT